MTWVPLTCEDRETLRKIMADPFDAAVFEFESGKNPLAKNPLSSASGAFQLIKTTAKALGVKDVFDITDNYNGYLKLKHENMQKFGNDFETLYQAHYLGAPLLRKVLSNQILNKRERDIYDYYIKKVRPKFKATLNKYLGIKT